MLLMHILFETSCCNIVNISFIANYKHNLDISFGINKHNLMIGLGISDQHYLETLGPLTKLSSWDLHLGCHFKIEEIWVDRICKAGMGVEISPVIYLFVCFWRYINIPYTQETI